MQCFNTRANADTSQILTIAANSSTRAETTDFTWNKQNKLIEFKLDNKLVNDKQTTQEIQALVIDSRTTLGGKIKHYVITEQGEYMIVYEQQITKVY